MPARRRILSPPRKAPQRRGPPGIAAIEADRQRLVAELGELGKREGYPAKPIQTARTLLTRLWAGATWKARRQLIQAAEWLVRLERNRAWRSDFRSAGE